MDTLTENMTFPCEPATEDELIEIFQSIASGFIDNSQKLERIVAVIEEDYIPWSSIHTLCIFGRDNSIFHWALSHFHPPPGVIFGSRMFSPHLFGAKPCMNPGIYINHNGNCLLLVDMEDTILQAYIDRCGRHLEMLMLCSTNLQHLDLSALTALKTLYVRDNPDITTLNNLARLTQLTELDLSGCSSLTQLPSLDNLKKLTKLDLSMCFSLRQLPPINGLKKLTELYLIGCDKLRILPAELRSMEALQILDLSRMHLHDLPDWLPEIAEGFSLGFDEERGTKKAIVSLNLTTVEAIPDMSIFDQPYEVVAEWFKNRSLGKTRTLNEIKVVFLGDGEAGKSHTIARLMGDGGAPVDYTDKSTPGIVIKHKPYTHDGRDFRVHYWDFGGQEIMHSMHRIFLTNRTMYVVLLNARDDTQGDRAHYWLQNIQSFAPDAPVLLVLNKIDQNPKASVDERTLRAKYPGLTQVIPMSALEFSKERFNKEFRDVLLDEIVKTRYLEAQWPEAWIKVKEQPRQLRLTLPPEGGRLYLGGAFPGEDELTVPTVFSVCLAVVAAFGAVGSEALVKPVESGSAERMAGENAFKFLRRLAHAVVGFDL